MTAHYVTYYKLITYLALDSPQYYVMVLNRDLINPFVRTRIGYGHIAVRLETSALFLPNS